MASTPAWGGALRPIPTPTANYDDSGMLLNMTAPSPHHAAAGMPAPQTGRLSPVITVSGNQPLTGAPVPPPPPGVLNTVNVNGTGFPPAPRGKSASPGSAVGSMHYVGSQYRGRNAPATPTLYSTAPVIERMGGTTKGPTIFVPGTTITKEDVEILNMRYAADMEEANAEIAELTNQLNAQRALTKELTGELERTRSREKSILRTTKSAEEHKVESNKQLEAVSALLEATERELIAKTNDVLNMKEENDILTGQLARLKDDLQAECGEGDMLRARFQKQEAEIEAMKATLASQQKQTDELMKVNGLYKATHEKYVKEGQLAAQLITTVETLKREVSEAEIRLTDLHNARINEARVLLADLKDAVNVLIPLVIGVKELHTAQENIRGAARVPHDPRDLQHEECLNKLRAAAGAELMADVRTPVLTNIATMVEASGAAGGDGVAAIDVSSLQKELEHLREGGSDAHEASAMNLDVLRDVCRKVSEVISICVGEVQTCVVSQSQEMKHIASLQEQVSLQNEKNGPLLEQLERLGGELARWQKEAGAAQAQLDHEVNSNREMKEAQSSLEYREKDLLRRLEAAQLENERMKTFMAKLQIADVPQLHNILQPNPRGTPKVAAAATPQLQYTQGST